MWLPHDERDISLNQQVIHVELDLQQLQEVQPDDAPVFSRANSCRGFRSMDLGDYLMVNGLNPLQLLARENTGASSGWTSWSCCRSSST